jgi:nucleoside-diphosphate-sugar epimerase
MRVLFTGASSFTGLWFATALAKAGHAVTATFTRPHLRDYDGSVKGRRIGLLRSLITPVFGCRFGDERFISAIVHARPDVLCHHGAEVTNYKSIDFDYTAAYSSNTNGIRTVISALQGVGCRGIVLTGSVFEAGEGAGSDGLPNFSPYGLSKFLTSATFSYFCQREKMPLGKFVIPNPFGPWEEERFTAYLIRCWRACEVAVVRAPEYVRDNIHVSLLAAAYQAFVSRLPGQTGFAKINPSEYAETQREFASRFAREIGSRLKWFADLEFAVQTDFGEPISRVNTDKLDEAELNWNERLAWDELADFYGTTVAD